MDKDAVLTALAALAHASRLDIFRRLVEYRPAGLPAGRIGALLRIGPTNLSFHLHNLRAAGLIVSRRKGRSLIYTACTEAIDALTDFLRENCCTASATADAVGPPPRKRKRRRTPARRGAGRAAKRHRRRP
jgi:DNA-binding transcriptional ArsR family regulator